MPENKDKSLHYAVLGLALMGSFMIVSTNVGNTTSNSLAIVTVSIKQILFIIAGYTAMMLASKLMNFRLIYRLDKILVFVVLLLMIIPLFGKAYLGSRAWIYLNLGVTDGFYTAFGILQAADDRAYCLLFLCCAAATFLSAKCMENAEGADHQLSVVCLLLFCCRKISVRWRS